LKDVRNDHTTAEKGKTTTGPVYLRNQSRPEEFSPKPPRKRSSRWWRLGIAAAAVGAVTLLGWLALDFLDTDPRFRLHGIELRGRQYVALAEVERVFQKDRDHSLRRLPLQERRLAVEDIPWVRTATVSRIFPDQVWVSVQERTPVAYLWTRRGIVLIDGEGVILQTPPGAVFSLPVVRGVSERDTLEKRRVKMRRFTTLTDALAAAGSPQETEISEVDLTNAEDARLILTGPSGALRLHLGADQYAQRYEAFLRHISQWRQQFGNIESIDLRYDGQVVIHAGIPLRLPLESDSPPKPSPFPQPAPGATPPGAAPAISPASR
jgi:cell division protein FtsQ